MITSTTTTNSATTATLPSDRVAVITGSNKGIGYYIALQLGLSGLFQHIVLACRDTTRGAVAMQSIQEQFAAAAATAEQCSTPVQVSLEPLTLGDVDSHQQLADRLAARFDNKIDVLVNNAAIAYKGSDPTPHAQQCQPTLDVNFRGTVDLTQRLLPLLRQGSDARIVNVASMSGRLGQLSASRQPQFTAADLTMTRLQELVNEYQQDVVDGTYKTKGWGNSNYGFSKLAVIAATKIWAREEASNHIVVNCCCPGYCRTDMSSQQGTRDPADGAKNAVIPATMKDPPTGEFFADYKVSEW